MLTPSTRLRLQAILARISRDEPVSLQERIELQKYADHNPTVAGWLRQARRRRCQSGPVTGIDRLLDDLNLGPADPEERHRPGQDDLGEWFGGAPGWVAAQLRALRFHREPQPVAIDDSGTPPARA